MSSTSNERIVIVASLLLLLPLPSSSIGFSWWSPPLTSTDKFNLKRLQNFSHWIKAQQDFLPLRDKRFAEPPFNIHPRQAYSQLEHAAYMLRMFEMCVDGYKDLDYPTQCSQVHNLLRKCGLLKDGETPLMAITSDEARELLRNTRLYHHNTKHPEFIDQFDKLYIGDARREGVGMKLNKFLALNSRAEPFPIADTRQISEDDRYYAYLVFASGYLELVLYVSMANFVAVDSSQIPNCDTSYRYFVSSMLITEPATYHHDGNVRDFRDEVRDIIVYLDTIDAGHLFTGDTEPDKTAEFARRVADLALNKKWLEPVRFKGVLDFVHDKSYSVVSGFADLLDPDSPCVSYEKLLKVLANNYQFVKTGKADPDSLREWVFRKFYFYLLFKFYEQNQAELEQLYNDLFPIKDITKDPKDPMDLKDSNDTRQSSMCSRLNDWLVQKYDDADATIKGWFPNRDYELGIGIPACLLAIVIGFRNFYKHVWPDQSTSTTPEPTSSMATARETMSPLMIGLIIVGILVVLLVLALVAYYVYTLVTKRDPLGLMSWIERFRCGKVPPPPKDAAGKLQGKPKSGAIDNTTRSGSSRSTTKTEVRSRDSTKKRRKASSRKRKKKSTTTTASAKSETSSSVSTTKSAKRTKTSSRRPKSDTASESTRTRGSKRERSNSRRSQTKKKKSSKSSHR